VVTPLGDRWLMDDGEVHGIRNETGLASIFVNGESFFRISFAQCHLRTKNDACEHHLAIRHFEGSLGIVDIAVDMNAGIGAEM